MTRWHQHTVAHARTNAIIESLIKVNREATSNQLKVEVVRLFFDFV